MFKSEMEMYYGHVGIQLKFKSSVQWKAELGN